MGGDWCDDDVAPPQYTASPVQTSHPTKGWLRRNGTSRVPYEKVASPERAEHFPYEKVASPERDEPRSLQKNGFAGTHDARSLQNKPINPYCELLHTLKPRPQNGGVILHFGIQLSCTMYNH